MKGIFDIKSWCVIIWPAGARETPSRVWLCSPQLLSAHQLPSSVWQTFERRKVFNWELLAATHLRFTCTLPVLRMDIWYFFLFFLHFPNIIVASVFKVWVAWWPGRLPAIPAGLVAAPSDAETARAAAPPVSCLLSSCLLSPVSCPAPVIRETCLQHRITPDGEHLPPRISFPPWRRRRKGQKKCLFEHFS